MGWERKRGKLLDLNKLLFGEFDAFPVKAGPHRGASTASATFSRSIPTTQLPRGAAARLVGAIAHPLNQAVIDPKLRHRDFRFWNPAAAYRGCRSIDFAFAARCDLLRPKWI